MVYYKTIIIRFLCMGEILFFLINFLYAENGLPAILSLQHENEHLMKEIQQIKESLIAMEEQLLEWNRYPYYKEKVAREQLQMVRNDEVIYFNI